MNPEIKPKGVGMLNILHLGVGLQSSCLMLMSCRGLLPRFDCAIFADTQYESKLVYRQLEWLTEEAGKAGIPVHTVTVGNLREDALAFRQHRRSADGKRFASVPFYVLNPDGSQGILTRQCTSEYKIEPIERFIKRELLGIQPRCHAPREVVVRCWMGISKDEMQRCKGPAHGVKRKVVKKVAGLFGEEEVTIMEESIKVQWWKTHVFPLCDLELWPTRKATRPRHLPEMMTREGCKQWLADHYPGQEISRSACLCCPYRSNAEWRYLKESDPESWEDAVAFDRDLRLRDAAGEADRKVLVGIPFVHRQMVPLEMADLRDDKGALWEEECTGMCGV